MKFPDGFLWGASTSAYQVEGDVQTQWSEWERANAQRLSEVSPKKLAWLPHATENAPFLSDPANYVNEKSIEHYDRYETDFDLLGELNLNAFRFGFEWARLQPREGEWDQSAIKHYHDYIAALKQRGIEPVPTLWHWTMPTWFTDKGGFEKRANLQYFDKYVQKIADEFGADFHYLLTLNEPNVYAAFSYGTGEWPPQRKNPVLLLRVYQNLAEAHRRAYKTLKAQNPNLQISLANQLGDVRPANAHNPLDHLFTAVCSYVWNWWFLDCTRQQQDFVGLNYYFTEYRNWLGQIKNPAQPLNDLGWYMQPGGIERLLGKVWKRYKLPILITENGLADASDTQRQWWISETLGALETAMQAGVPILGYLHWSLLDNFEWAYGWWPKFGLVAVDRTTMKRTVRPSAHWFAREIEKR